MSAMEAGGEAKIETRKIVTFVLLSIIGSLVIAALLASFNPPPSQHSFQVINKVFNEKVCKESLIEHVLNPEELKKVIEKGMLNVKEVCRPVSLTSPDVKLRQVIAAVIFYVSILGAVMFWERRAAPVFVGLVFLVVLGVMPFRLAVESMELPLILFLIATMVIVGYMKEAGLLRFITVKVLSATLGRPKRFLFLLLLLSFVLSALVGEVSSIVYITLLILETSQLIGLNPVPWVILAVFATNLGSAATMIGNPIGIYIGLYFNKSFMDFIYYSLPAAFLSLLVMYPLSVRYLAARGELDKLAAVGRLELDPWEEVRNKLDFYLSGILFILMVIGIALHVELASAVTEMLQAMVGPSAPAVSSDAMLVLVPLLITGIVLWRSGFNARKLIEERVEWWALVFFMFLFAEAAALSYSGVTDLMAYSILEALGGGKGLGAGLASNLLIMVTTAIASGFVDNMPIIVALSPVAKTLLEIGLTGAFMLPWSLLFGGTFGGNLTIIGSTANIVAVGMIEKRGIRIDFAEWIKIGGVVVGVTLLVAYLWTVAHIIVGW